MANNYTAEETAAAWRRLLADNADLPQRITARQVSDVIERTPTSARQWLVANVGPSVIRAAAGGGLVGTWLLEDVRAAVRAADDRGWTGNRTSRRGPTRGAPGGQP